MPFRVCSKCKQDKDESDFKDSGPWCTLCKDTYHKRMQQLQTKYRQKVQDRQNELQGTVTLSGVAEEKLAVKDDWLDEIVTLAQKVGAAKHKAMASKGLVSAKSWRLYYVLKEKLERKTNEARSHRGTP